MAEKKDWRSNEVFFETFCGCGKNNRREVTVGDSIKFSATARNFTDVIESMEVDNKIRAKGCSR